MNVQKVSKFIPIAAAFFLFFGADIAFAAPVLNSDCSFSWSYSYGEYRTGFLTWESSGTSAVVSGWYSIGLQIGESPKTGDLDAPDPSGLHLGNVYARDYLNAPPPDYYALGSDFDVIGIRTAVDTCTPPIPPVPNISDFIISTSTATARVKGYWEATTTPYVSQRLSFWQYSDSLGKESYEQLIATTTGNFDFTFDFRDPYAWSFGESSTTPIYSNFTLYASLDQYDETNYVFPYGGTIIDNLDATSTAILTSEYNASDFISTPRDLALYPEYECSITSMMGCIKNALIWTFYPTQDALDSWTSLKTTLETKAPIGYFYSVKNAVGGLSATSTPSFSLTIPSHLKQYFFDPFDTGIAGILWFFFIFHFYKRLKNIQI